VTDEPGIPILLQFMFGEKAAAVRNGASERLLMWGRAFEDWLAERKDRNHRATYTHFRNAWKRLLGRCGKAPWEVTAQAGAGGAGVRGEHDPAGAGVPGEVLRMVRGAGH
jgi:hypothetical protein